MEYDGTLEIGHPLEKPTHKSFIDKTGWTRGLLSVIEYRGKTNNKHYWLCQCSCVNKTLKIIDSGHLGENGVKSCCCLLNGQQNIKHQKCNTAEYHSWSGMKSRCFNKKDRDFQNYGERGIRVCKRWLNSFENFYADMGPKPSQKHSIDRINNDKDYCPENCRWATIIEQNRNKRNSIILLLNDESHSIDEWSEIKNIKRSTIEARLRYGWTTEKILNTPTNHYNRKNNGTNSNSRRF